MNDQQVVGAGAGDQSCGPERYREQVGMLSDVDLLDALQRAVVANVHGENDHEIAMLRDEALHRMAPLHGRTRHV